MSYQVIARKYRPQRFSDVVGQEHVTQTLANAISQNRIAHAYLFVGPRGTGKTTLARIFAKCLNCTDGPKVDFSDNDPQCREIAEGRSLDVLEIDGASNRGIEEVRELRETVKYAPATSRFKIYIIDEVHMLTKEAFNALLKTLEEPPAHVKFMFATTEPEKVLATILSRCQRFDLRRIPTPLIVEHLARIAKLENVEIQDTALHAVARGADGGMRDAQSALDQLISFCGSRIEEGDVLSMFGLTARTQIVSIAGALLTGDAPAALRALDDLAKKGKDLNRLLSDLLGHCRNLLLFQISNGDLSLLDVSEAEVATLAEQSRLSNTDTLTRIMDLLSEFEGRLREAASKRILVEVALLKAAQARNAVSIDTLLQKLQQLRNQSGGDAGSAAASPEPRPTTSVPSTPTATPAKPVTVAPRVSATPAEPRPATPAMPMTAASPPGPPAVSNAPAPPDLKEAWRKVVTMIGQNNPFARTYLGEAHPVSLARNVLTLGYDPSVADHLELVDNNKIRALIQGKWQELGLNDIQIKFVKAERPSDWLPPETPAPPEAPAPTASAPAPLPASAAKAPSPEPRTQKAAPITVADFKNDPLIKQALEIFKGQIVEVRA